MKIRILNLPTIAQLIDMPKVVEAVQKVFEDYGRGEAQMPPKVYLDAPPWGDFRAMPALAAGLAGVKWVNSHPGNPQRSGLPTVMAMILLNDPETARPLALLDGTLITALRTGAAAAVATRLLARPGAASLGMIGCGAQAVTHIKALRCVMNLERVALADARPEAAQSLAERFPDLPCEPVEPAQAAACDVVGTLTPARTPVLRREWIRPGCHINAMGADAPGKQELDPEILQAARIFVDDWAQASHSGEINVALRSGKIGGVAGSLPDALCGKIEGRTGDGQITVFDSTGLAIQDLAVARLVYDEACRRGEGMEVDFPLTGGV